MNKQGINGIEWCDYTWNPVTGCFHRCRWQMPDGVIAKCYAETVAGGMARNSYRHGFAHHYYHPQRLDEPLMVRKPSRIFLDSMGDLMGHWVPSEQIEEVLDVVRRAEWHTFLLLTKNAPRLLQFQDEFPDNLHIGVSMPPTHMWGKEVSPHQQEKLFRRSLDVLDQIDVALRWASFEPLSFDVAMVLEEIGVSFEWAVIGAASNGKQYYQPEASWVARLHEVLDAAGVAVFHKGNLNWSERRREYLLPRLVEQLELF